MSWKLTNLVDVVDTVESGGRPKGGATEDTGEIPSLGGENILRSGGVSLQPVKRIPTRYFESMKKGHLRNGDVLINKDGAQTGKVGLYLTDYESNAAINEHLFLIRGNSELISQEYLYFLLLSQLGQSQIVAQISGSAQPGLKSDFLEGILVEIPEAVSEQSKIAEILSTVDQAIDQTEALIAKQQRIKTGLMQDLLTRGIDEQGNLRSEETHEFKDSPLGRIPVEWEVDELVKCCSEVVDCPHSTPEYTNYGVACIRTADMIPGRLLLDKVFRVSEQSYQDRISRLCPLKDDIIYSREGERLGIAAPVGSERVCLGQRVMLLRTSSDNSANYILWAMNEPDFYRRVVLGLGATTSPHINVVDVKANLIRKPQRSEQEIIGNFLTKQEAKIAFSECMVAKFYSLRTAIMQDLLTGKKRVTALLDSEVPV